MCRFARQNIYDVLGRDKVTSPLTAFEWRIFQHAIQRYLKEEYESDPNAQLGISTEDN